MQERRGWTTAEPVRHAAPLPLFHGAGGTARTDAAHPRVGPIVRISRAHYHTVVLLGGHGAGNTIRAHTTTHFTLHFTITFGAHFLLVHFLLFHALASFITDISDITTRTYTFRSTCNNTNKSLDFPGYMYMFLYKIICSDK